MCAQVILLQLFSSAFREVSPRYFRDILASALVGAIPGRVRSHNCVSMLAEIDACSTASWTSSHPEVQKDCGEFGLLQPILYLAARWDPEQTAASSASSNPSFSRQVSPDLTPVAVYSLIVYIHLLTLRVGLPRPDAGRCPRTRVWTLLFTIFIH